MDDVGTTKRLIQNLRDHGWSKLLGEVAAFCSKQGITVPDMNGYYADFIQSRSSSETTVEHHYRYGVFIVAIDQQMLRAKF